MTATIKQADRARLVTALAGVLGLLVGLGCGSSEEPAPGQEQPATSGRIYATVSADAEVLVIDDQSHEVLNRIPVGEGPAILLATPDYKKLYSANWADDSISAITVEGEQSEKIAVSGRPYVIAMAPDGQRLYAGLDSNEIIVIDTASDEVVESWPTTELAASLIVSPDGETLYVAILSGLGNGKLRAISTADGSIIHEHIEVGASPAWITIGKDGSRVYTLNFLSDDVTAVDTESWTVADTIDCGQGSQGIIGNVTPDGSRLYVTNYGSAELIAIDTASNEIVQTIDLTGRPVGVNFSPDGKRVYTTDFGTASLESSSLAGLTYLTTGVYDLGGEGQIRAFDVETGEQVGETVVVGPGPTSLVVVPPATK